MKITLDRRIIVATTQEALQITTVVPSFTVDDLQKSIRFYEGLGFIVSERWEDKGTLKGVMLRAGKTEIGLSQDDWKKGRDRKKGVGLRVLMSTTQNVDDVAARAKSAGIALKSEPFDSEWKTRVFEVVDPSGFLLTISSAPAK
jgi:catechol 2,3-dioxygenase-like lactoylglutathione lyase family enzyme